MTQDLVALGAAVRAATTYQAAADALGMPYPEVYRAARRERLAVAPAPRPIAPEPTTPILSSWIPIPPGIVAGRVVAIRLDQHRRVRALIRDLGDGWHSWELRDAASGRIDKPGLRGSRQGAEAGADEALADLGWLPPIARARVRIGDADQRSGRPEQPERDSVHGETPLPCRAATPLTAERTRI